MSMPPVTRAWRWFLAGPAYPPDDRDRRSFGLLGVQLPVRATLALVAVTLILLLDYHGRILSLVAGLTGPGATTPSAMRVQSIARALLLGVVPLVLVVLVLRDRPSRYGIRLGDVRAGLVIAAAGVAVMLPIVVLALRMPGFAAYYAPQGGSAPDVILTTALEVIPAEFFFRGFLLFALLRSIGPLGLVVATLPFAFAHLGKPEIETMSTIGGGFLYGWLDWRTGSVLWSGLAHTAILSFTVLAAAALAPTGAA